MIERIQKAVRARLRRIYGRFRLQSRFRSEASGMVFLIGHMRTGSTLLVHILCDNPGIVGYGETHYSYSEKSDVYASALKIYEETEEPLGDEYTLDKVLHRRLMKNDSVVFHPAVKVIFLVRSPAESLSSMLEADVVSSPDHAVEHYIGQLTWISGLASQIEFENATFTTYEQLIQNTDEVLSGLRRFLDLEAPLRPEYSTMQSTGVYGVGDPGPHIHAGTVKTDIDRDIDPRVEPYLEETRRVFDDCLEDLGLRCAQLTSQP